MFKLILVILACALFPAKYGICEYFYPGCTPEIVNNWDKLNHWIRSFDLGILGAAMVIRSKPGVIENITMTLVYSLVYGMIAPDLVDKLLHEYGFHWYDLIWYIIGLYGACKYWFKEFHNKIGQAIVGEKIYTYITK